jgi:ribonuclease G
MAKEIVVNVGERETRIAVLEDGKLVELHIERAERVVGSLYKCRVSNVLPGMDAAFVDIGLDRNGFLYVGDVLPSSDTEQMSPAPAPAVPAGNGRDRAKRYGKDAPRGRDRNDKPKPGLNTGLIAEVVTAGRVSNAPASEYALEDEDGDGASAADRAEQEGQEDLTLMPDNVSYYEAQARSEAARLAEFDADLVEDELEGDDLDEDETDDAEDETTSGAGGNARKSLRPKSGYRRSTLRAQRISDVLKVGQEVLVQVIKGPRSTKGARVSTRISLPGRYLVLMPEADNLGVSRKIEDSKERDRLKKIGDKIRVSGFGLIIRTEAEDKTEQELKADMDFLVQNWRQVQENARKMAAPALVLQDLTLLYKTIRDVFGSDVSKLVIDDPAEYEKANDLLDRISPKLKGRIQLYDGPEPIFDRYNLENEIERLTKRKVFLKSGGSLVIDETEALTVIDVNSSKNVGGSSLAETIVRTNIDAAAEIGRQLRLRDIGGIIVIDFIDMNNPRDKQSVLKSLETALKKDRSRTKISNISPLGLVEMTRKRTGETLSGFMTDECPYCKGRGHLPSPESVSLLVERDLHRQINTQQNAKKDAFLIRCHPEVAELLIGPDGATVEEIERQVLRAVFIRADEDAHVEAYTITPGDLSDFEKNRLNYRRAQVVECRIMRSLLKEPGKCIGWADGYMLDLDDGQRFIGQKAKVRITDVRRSYAVGTVVPGTNRSLDVE